MKEEIHSTYAALSQVAGTANRLQDNLCSSIVRPARYPRALPEFFIKMLTDEGDLVLNPFAGSNTTGAVAESLQRRWIAFDNVEEYLRASKFRFSDK